MLSINQSKCIQCEECINDCHRKALSMEEDRIIHDPDICMWCGHCLAVCPRDCIIIDGDGYDCEEVEDLGFAPLPTKVQMRNMILARRSIRRFLDEPVSADDIDMILEAGKYSPTGMNLQGNAFVLVYGENVASLAADSVAAFERLIAAGRIDEDNIARYKKLCDDHNADGKDEIYYSAPLIIFVFADTEADGAIAASTMSMMAQSLKLGTCFERIPVCAYDDELFAEKWEGVTGKKCILCLAVGKPEPEYFCSVPRKDPIVIVKED